MDLALCIEKPLQELKSTLSRGFFSEILVLRFVLHNTSWQLFALHGKTPYSEVDLIFYKENRVLLIEVKSVTDYWTTDHLTLKQLKRLSNSFEYLIPHFQSVEFILVTVDAKNKLRAYKEFLVELV